MPYGRFPSSQRKRSRSGTSFNGNYRTTSNTPSITRSRPRVANTRYARVFRGSVGLRTKANGQQGMWIQRSLIPFPTVAHLRCDYVDTQSISTSGSGSNVYTRYQWRMNGLHDPNFTGTGHQPYQYDQVVACGYNTFVVYKCEWDIEFFDPSIVDSLYVCVAVQPDSNTGADISGATVGTVAEKRWAEQKYVSLSGNQRAHFSGVCNVPKLLGVTYATLTSNQNYWSPAGANTTAGYLALLNVGLCDPAGETAQGFIKAVVKLRFHFKAFTMVSVTTS